MSDKKKKAATGPRVCRKCGTRLGESATRCVVCGSEVRGRGGGGTLLRKYDVTLSLPLALLMLVVFSLLSAGLTFAAMRFTGLGSSGEPTNTPTLTPTEAPTLEPTATDTPWPTPTPHPPTEHTISIGETCYELVAIYEVSLRSIMDLNPGLRCEMLSVGQIVLVPYPTPTPSPQPTATLSDAEATEAACDRVTYTVQADDTLSGIATNYNVEMQAIMEYNGMTSVDVLVGQVLIIPLCRRLPTPGPTPTPTLPPPYPAPNLLLPQDGAAFTLAEDAIALQWASVGQLRENEYYQVTVLDVTEGTGSVRLIGYVKDTKYIVPTSFRPTESTPHIMRWWVTPVRQVGLDAQEDPIYDSAGSTSVMRDFTWSGAALTTPVP
ncbi:MAG: LysM peptidoglycan-binding domain-containing protein [Anaerolineales bacterium]